MTRENPHYEDALDIIEEDGATIARLQAQLAAARAKLDALDCTSREGGDTRHCRVDAKCLRCQLAAERTAREAVERDLRLVRAGGEAVERDLWATEAKSKEAEQRLQTARAALEEGAGVMATDAKADAISIQQIDAAMGAVGWDLRDPHGAAECLLADLRHWCRAHRVSFSDAVRASRQMYREDRQNRSIR